MWFCWICIYYCFFVNLLFVFFGKYTKAKGIFLTGNTGVAHAQAFLWLVIYIFGFGTLTSSIVAGIILGIFWAYGTTLPIKTINHVTNDAGFTIGHNQMFGIWFFGKIGRFFGDPEKEDAEKLSLPGWLGVFDHNVTAIAIIMTIFVGGFLLSIGIPNVQELAGKEHWLIYIIKLGLQFSMYMVILLQGVRMLVGEINQSFKGIQERLIPNAVPAVDVAALLPFSPNAATLGFIFTTLGTVFTMGLLVLFKSPIMVLPGFVPLFFSGGPIGVVANKYGGYKSTIICTFLLGIIQTLGTVWAILISGVGNSIGWTGMFDWATVVPFITEIMRFVAKVFGLG
nr:PTS transporter subunit IIC [Aerococcus loyolae]